MLVIRNFSVKYINIPSKLASPWLTPVYLSRQGWQMLSGGVEIRCALEHKHLGWMAIPGKREATLG